MIAIKRNQIDIMEKFYRISLINSLIGFKPINLLGTCNVDGAPNLSIISSAFHLGANPPLIGLVMRPQREHNDTLKNIQETKHYTLNNVLPQWYPQAHQTSASYASGISEFEKCNFNELYTDGFQAPFVRESTVRIGLELREIMDVPINGTTIVIGEIVQLLLDDLLIEEDGTVDHIKAGSMTISGLDRYFLPDFVGRLSYAKPGMRFGNQKIAIIENSNIYNSVFYLFKDLISNIGRSANEMYKDCSLLVVYQFLARY